MAEQWMEHGERSNKMMLTLLALFAKYFGRGALHILLYPIVAYFYSTGLAAKRASREFLTKALGREPTRFEVFKHFYTYAVVSADRLFLLSGRTDQFDVEMTGLDLFDPLVEDQRGCVLLVSHFGSYEVMRVRGVKEFEFPIKILMKKGLNPQAVQLIDALDPDLAARILDADVSAPVLAMQLDECIKAGDFVGIMADRSEAKDDVIYTEFLGEKAAFPLGPWMLALVLKAPIIHCCGVYEGGNKYRVHFEKITDSMSASRSERQQVIESHVKRYVESLENYVHRSPYNWFNFYHFWNHETTTNH